MQSTFQTGSESVQRCLREGAFGVVLGGARTDLPSGQVRHPFLCFRQACVKLDFQWPTVIIKGTQ
jgi:hypothetical protein